VETRITISASSVVWLDGAVLPESGDTAITDFPLLRAGVPRGARRWSGFQMLIQAYGNSCETIGGPLPEQLDGSGSLLQQRPVIPESAGVVGLRMRPEFTCP
jgi:hypothetical protein